MRTTLKIFCGFVLLWLVVACDGRLGGTTESGQGVEPHDEVRSTGSEAAPGCQAGTYKIAYQGPLTGEFGRLGEDMVNGIRFAVDEANDLSLAGEGVRIEVEPFDSQGSGDQASPLASQAAEDEEIVAMVGPTLWHETEVSGPIFEQAELPFITPSATSAPQSEEAWKHFFRMVGSDIERAKAAAVFMTDHLDASTVAVLDDSSPEYGLPLADAVADALGQYGGEVVHRASVAPERDDYSAEVAEVVSSGAEAVYFGGYSREAGVIKRQLVAMGAGSIPFVGDEGVYDARYLDAAGIENAEPTYVAFRGMDPNSAAPEFTQAYRDAHGAGPGAFTLEAHDAARLVIEGLRWGACERSAMRHFLANFHGEVRGREISFDENGDIEDPRFTVYRALDDGWAVEVQNLAPAPIGAPVESRTSPQGSP